MNGWAGDFILAWRRLSRRRGLSAIAAGTLALALAACLVIFSVFAFLLLSPLPYPASNALISVRSTGPVLAHGGARASGSFSAPDYLDLRAATPALAGLAGYFPNGVTLSGGSPPQHIAYTSVSGNFFQVLGVPPMLGRAITLRDEIPPIPQVAVLSNALWYERYGGNPHIVGQTIWLDHQSLTVIGVMPPGFDFPRGSELWAPEPFSSPFLQRRNARFMTLIARLRRPAQLHAARQNLSQAASRLAQAYPDADSGLGIAVEPLQAVLDAPFRDSLWLLLFAGLLLFGVACANVANLLVADAVTRRREMAVRASLGASRLRLVLQFLIEGSVLALCSCLCGWLLAALALPLLRRIHVEALPQLRHVSLDARVLLFALGITVATAVWLGLAPAWELLRLHRGRSLQSCLREDGRRSRIQAWVAAAEVSATVVLLIGAGLLWRSVRNLDRIDPGFQPSHAITFRASLMYTTMAELDARSVYFQDLDRELRRLPGVAAFGMISELPLGSPQQHLHFFVAGSPAGAALREVERPEAVVARTLPGYFAAAGIPVAGRDFNFSDNRSSARVVIVSRNLAHDLFPRRDPIGRSLEWGAPGAPVISRIVGVAGDVRQNGLGQPPGWEIYEPYLQSPSADMTGVVRTRGNPWVILPAVQRAAAAVNPQIPLYRIATLRQPLRDATAPERFRAGLLLAMASLALLLAAAGVYSLLAHQVEQRRHEIGVRMALGASPAQLRAMVMRQSLRICVLGAAAGLVLAGVLAFTLRSLLFGVAPVDPLTFLLVPAVLVAVGAIASFVPARRATRVDPVIALRCE